MTQTVLARPLDASAEEKAPSALLLLKRFVSKSLAIAGMEAQKMMRDRTELFTRAVQPVLWLLVFGQVLAGLRAIPTGYATYLDYLTPGILAQSVLFVAIFFGIAIIWERDVGVLQKFLVSPTPRAALATGKALSAGVRSVTQVVIIYLVAALLRVDLSWNPLRILGVFAVVFLGAALFSTLSLIIASLVKTRERFMGIGQVITMPLFFASNAIYPIAVMPRWLQVVARANPLSYMVEALHALMVKGGPAISAGTLALDFGVLLGGSAVLVAVLARMYGRLA